MLEDLEEAIEKQVVSETLMNQKTSEMVNLVFALLLIVWSVVFQETWKRKQN